MTKKNVTPAPKPVPAPKTVVTPPPAPVAKEVVTFNLQFDFDSSTIKEGMIPSLHQAKEILEEDQISQFAVFGHTCSMGPDTYNQKLSERRASAIRKWLVDNGIEASRLDAKGYGESLPKDGNANNEGRKLNRRVELVSK